MVDSEMQGKNLQVLAGAYLNHAYYEVSVYSINELEETSQLLYYKAYGSGWQTVTIPEDCIKLKFVSYVIGSTQYSYFKEINICNEPVFQENKNYPILTANGVTNLISKMDISYFPSSDRKVYKIDEGEWRDYTGTITVNVGSTVYAKGIFSNGKETKISECIASVPSDAIGSKAYDGNYNTYEKGIARDDGKPLKLCIDESAVGKRLKIKFLSSNHGAYGYGNFKIFDDGGNIIYKESSVYDYQKTITIPERAVMFWYCGQINNYLYEIEILD